MSEAPRIQVEATPKFQRNLHSLAKKYRSIRKDLEPVIEQLQQGELAGERIPDVGYSVFKLRVRNSDIKKGKSGSYRLIYYLATSTGIVLITIYAKSEQANIAAEDLRSIIEAYEQN